MRVIILSILSIITFSLYAQEVELITDRPDQTESAAIVPLKSLQIETGFMGDISRSSLIEKYDYSYNLTLLRYGLLENFELRLGLGYLGNVTIIKPVMSPSVNGLSPLHAGFKLKIAEENGWKPEIALLGGLGLQFTAYKDYKSSYTSGGMRFAFSNTLSERISVGYNLGIEWDGEDPQPAYFYSIAFGFSLTEKLGMFVEGYGLMPEQKINEHLLDAGFTYLLLPNLQFDVSGGIQINELETQHFFFSCGASWLLMR